MAGDQSKAFDEFIGDVAADILRSTGKAVKQAGKAYRKGTSFTLRGGLTGTADGEIVEQLQNKSGLALHVTPGPIVTQVGGSLDGSLDRARQMQAQANGGLGWWLEWEIRNAVALDGEDEPAGGGP